MVNIYKDKIDVEIKVLMFRGVIVNMVNIIFKYVFVINNYEVIWIFF